MGALSIFPYRTTTIGAGSTPASELILANSIQGKALTKGWPTDSTAATVTTNVGQAVGHQTLGSGQLETVYYLAMPSRIKRGSRVISTTLRVKVIGSTFTANTVPGSVVTCKVWAIRRTLTASGTNLTGLTWANWFTASPWDELGVKLGIGNDVDPVEIGSFQWTQADHDAVPGIAVPIEKTVSLRAEFQFLLDTGAALQLLFTPGWAIPSGSNTQALITLSQPAGTASNPHSSIDFAWRQALEYYDSDASGNRDPLHMLAAESVGIDQHFWLGTPPRGAQSVVEKFFLHNELRQAQVACVTHSGRTQVGPVDHSGVVGSGWLRTARGYDTATGQVNRTATWKVTMTSATAYGITYQDEGTTGFISTGITSPTGRSINTDEVFAMSGNNVLSIPSAASGNWGGTIASGDVFTFDMRADMSDAGHPLSSLDDVRLVPHTIGNRSSADAAKARSARAATTQQAFRRDTSNFSGGVDDAGAAHSYPGVIARVDHSGTKRIHIKVSDPSQFVVDQWVTVANVNATDDTTAAGRVLHGHVLTVYALNDATWPGQIALYEDGTTLQTDFPDTGTIVCSGIWHGDLSPPAEGYLAAPTSTSSTRISLDAPLTRSTGTVTILDLATAATVDRVIDRLEGNDVILTLPPNAIYPVGAQVFFRDDISAECPLFLYAAPGITAVIARKEGYLAGASFAIV